MLNNSKKMPHCDECTGWACKELENISRNTVVRIIVDGRFPIQDANGNENLLFEDVEHDGCAIFTSPVTRESFRIDCKKITVIQIPTGP